ncbi:MAG: outer membrane beta-barrel protein [Bacteroidota bacterium]
MKKVLFSFLLLISFGLSAQDSTNTTLKHWAIGYTVSPDYCYRTVTSDGSASMNNIVTFRNENEVPQFGITSGFNVAYFFTKHFSIETGINYSNRGYRTKYFSDFISPSGTPDPFIPTKINYIYNYNFIDIPLKINFVAGKKKLHFIASAGISANFLLFLKETRISEYSDGRKITSYPKPQTGFDFSDLTMLLSAGTDINLTNKLNLRIEPTFRYSLGIKQTSPIKEHLWSAGLSLGFYYRF